MLVGIAFLLIQYLGYSGIHSYALTSQCLKDDYIKQNYTKKTDVGSRYYAHYESIDLIKTENYQEGVYAIRYSYRNGGFGDSAGYIYLSRECEELAKLSTHSYSLPLNREDEEKRKKYQESLQKDVNDTLGEGLSSKEIYRGKKIQEVIKNLK